MSITPDPAYKGASQCTSCGKPLDINDIGITYNGIIDGQDLLLCTPCIVPMMDSIAKDLMRLHPEVAFSERYFHKTKNKRILDLRNRASTLRDLATKMENWATDINW